MRFRTILSLAALLLGCSNAAVWSQPLPAQPDGSHEIPTIENQSISGKISSVGDASFAIDVMKENQERQTMQFLVDGNTKVEGKLTVGAQAMVEYRADGEKNIAVHVVVRPSSGVSAH
ncbi:MAG TPA: hypothetical protein VE077_19410 [Candidatus Methylomirabilis sp.]|nr:hypothetical protein [Candidatus Methylomirabilis sp.]